MQRQSVRTLPENPNPIGTRCIQITIPDDDEWERDLYGEVWRLTRWNLWERDLAHNGKPVADQWLTAIRTWKHCNGPSPIIHNGIMEDFEMPLRVDCDCNVFVTCCDGTEKQILTSDQVQKLVQGQPGAGTTPPGPGTCKTYDAKITSGSAFYLPLLVNTGDVLTLSNLDGSSSDAAPVGRWNCPSGLQFFGGICTGSPFIDAGAPAPTLPIGIPLFVVNGVYYDARSPLTVPGGISIQPAAIVLNYASGGAYAGDVTARLEVCNNQAGTFTHVFDFTLSDGGWAAALAGLANYVLGTGWTQGTLNGGPNDYTQVNIQIFFPSRLLTSVKVEFIITPGTFSDPGATSQFRALHATSSVWTFNFPSGAPPTSPWTYAFSAPVDQLDFSLYCSSSAAGGGGGGGTGVQYRITVEGIGTDPY